jgi:hypothetical protein
LGARIPLHHLVQPLRGRFRHERESVRDWDPPFEEPRIVRHGRLPIYVVGGRWRDGGVSDGFLVFHVRRIIRVSVGPNVRVNVRVNEGFPVGGANTGDPQDAGWRRAGWNETAESLVVQGRVESLRGRIGGGLLLKGGVSWHGRKWS